jgi:F-type H+-transporting ATPase subunit alpha
MNQMDSQKIASEINHEIEKLSIKPSTYSTGKILSISDGVVLVSGLGDAMVGEICQLEKGIKGVVLNLKRENAGIIVLGDYTKLNQGGEVRTTGEILEIGAGLKVIGRVINPLGEPLDGKGAISFEKKMRLERIAPRVVSRQSVNTPLQTGIKAIDSMFAIGRGQRELIIGDRNTGKTAIAIDTIINQKDAGVTAIYVAIGQKQSKVAQVVAKLEETGAMAYTTVIAANASDPVSLQYIAPYAGCALGEFFMEKGQDALIIYDDLTKHAWAYRQISLILKRPSGREAYPGDIFSLHSRLLERAARMNDKYGGGSLTALPIIETQAGDISAYIPTNVISITDGQIFLEADLFNAGIRPAINVGISVSRVGSDAQTKAMKQVAGKLKLDLAQYRELAAFAQFGSDLDKITREKLDRGARISEILKQPQYQTVPMAKQVVTFWMATNGYLDLIPVEKAREFEKKYVRYMETSKRGILEEIYKKKALSDELIEKIRKATEEFKTQWQTLEA